MISNFDQWRTLGDRLCIENMDKRKTTGRTADELAVFFAGLTEATLSFDIGHARQIDPTMCEADAIHPDHPRNARTRDGHRERIEKSRLAYRVARRPLRLAPSSKQHGA